MPEREFDFVTILNTLVDHDVDFIIVGGLCAVLNGAPINTYDLDIVPLRSIDNLGKLEEALLELQACYREHLPKRLLPEASRMNGPGHHLLATNAGLLDVLGSIAAQRDYDNLLPHTIELELQDGKWIRVLDLETLILTKEEAGREKDKLALPILRRTREEAQNNHEQDE